MLLTVLRSCCSRIPPFPLFPTPQRDRRSRGKGELRLVRLHNNRISHALAPSFTKEQLPLTHSEKRPFCVSEVIAYLHLKTMPPLRKMFSGFSGSLLSLDEADHVRDVKLEARPHTLTDGVDYFTTDGQPIRPQLCAHTLNKVFSGSALDLNASADEVGDSDSFLPQSSNGAVDSGNHDPTVSTILANLSQGTEQSRQRASKAKTTVLVVGAGGYVASHAVEAFLEAGYSVRATVDDISDEDLVKTLYSVHPESHQRLIVKEVNIFQAASFRDIMRGVHIVVHSGVSATSSKTKSGNPVKAHTEAVQALFDAVRSFGRGTVKRVVVLGAATPLTMAPQAPSTSLHGHRSRA